MNIRSYLSGALAFAGAGIVAAAATGPDVAATNLLAWLHALGAEPLLNALRQAPVRPLAFALGAMMLLGGGYAMWRSSNIGKRQSRDTQPIGEPLTIYRSIVADALKLVDERGRPIQGLEAIRVSLRLINTNAEGKTIRNIEARLYSVSGEFCVLPLRFSEAGRLRPGEMALIDLGYIAVAAGSVEALHQFEEVCSFNVEADRHNAPRGHLSLQIYDTRTHKRGFGIGATKQNPKFPNIQVIVTGDDVPATTVFLDMDLSGKRCWDWFTVKDHIS